MLEVVVKVTCVSAKNGRLVNFPGQFRVGSRNTVIWGFTTYHGVIVIKLDCSVHFQVPISANSTY